MIKTFCKLRLHNWVINYKIGERTCKWCGKIMIVDDVATGYAPDVIWVDAPDNKVRIKMPFSGSGPG